MIEIDGAMGEGGGQILRTSLALSLLTGQGFHLRRVRANRDKPGLRPQHLMSVRAAGRVSGAAMRGAALGSSELWFEPGELHCANAEFAIGTAGATSLVLHTIYLPVVLHASAACELVFQGGTHVNASPCFHFLDVTWRDYMARLGITVDLRMDRPGFYPRGGGIVRARLEPCRRLKGLVLMEPKPVERITVISAAGGLPIDIARRQMRRAQFRLRDTGIPITAREEVWPGDPGTMLAVILHGTPVPTLFFGLGARGKPAERVADEAAEQALAYLAGPASVDSHSADQLLLPLSMAEEPSSFRVSAVTEHRRTNAEVIQEFIDRPIHIEGGLGNPGIVTIGSAGKPPM